jgi:hypothetical protein
MIIKDNKDNRTVHKNEHIEEFDDRMECLRQRKGNEKPGTIRGARERKGQCKRQQCKENEKRTRKRNN